MKRLVVILVLLIFSQSVGAVSSDLRDVYSPRETIIAEIGGAILAPINLNQVSVKRENVEVGFEGDIKKIGNSYFIWLIAPLQEDDYTLIIKDIVEDVNGAPQVVDFQDDFSVQGDLIDYSINPGFIFAVDDFDITATLYEDFSKSISVSFLETKEITLYPGYNNIDFSIDGIIENEFFMITLGRYSIPAYIIGSQEFCGNSQIESGEICDSSNLNGNDCTTVGGGYIGGSLSCNNACLGFDVSSCESEPGAICDSEHFGLCFTQNTCVEFGGHWWSDGTCRENIDPGTPPLLEDLCNSNNLNLCFTYGTCIGSGGYWYNDKCNQNPKKSCGSSNLNLCATAGTCIGSGGYWYDKRCNSEECNVDYLVLCSSESVCTGFEGYWYLDRCNQYESGAQCDENHVGLCLTPGACINFGGYWYEEKCNEDPAPECGLENIELCVSKETCLEFDGYWYGGSCNSDECDSNYLHLCFSSESCLNSEGFWYGKQCNLKKCNENFLDLCDGSAICNSASGYWYDNMCNEYEKGAECDSNHVGLCLTPGVCIDLGGFWYGGKCNEERSEIGGDIVLGDSKNLPVYFIFKPRAIKRVAHSEEDNFVYSFEILNFGQGQIDSIFLFYDKEKLEINPDENISLEPNGSAVFELRWKDVNKRGVKSAILAYGEDWSDHLILNIGFSLNEEDIGTTFLKDNSEENSYYYCSELSGEKCGDGEICTGETVYTLDVSGCCPSGSECVNDSGGGFSYIGYLLAGIVILILIIVFMKYRGAGKKKNPTARRFSEAEKRLP
jgi:hypothetical protein